VRRLRAELVDVRREIHDAVEETHRHYRRELVPLSMAPVVYTGSGGRRR
jgi:hypothetical protein